VDSNPSGTSSKRHGGNRITITTWPDGDPCDTVFEYFGWDECNE
jgi:hypothetical protein